MGVNLNKQSLLNKNGDTTQEHRKRFKYGHVTTGKTRSMGAHGEQNTHRQSIFLTYRPPPGRRVPAPKKQQKEGWVGSREEAQEEDGHLGGGRQTESREVTKEGGARVDQTETGGAWSWQCQVGPRPQP